LFKDGPNKPLHADGGRITVFSVQRLASGRRG
jgi:hypothetical protein